MHPVRFSSFTHALRGAHPYSFTFHASIAHVPSSTFNLLKLKTTISQTNRLYKFVAHGPSCAVAISVVPARLGLKAPALAWPEPALAFSNPRPSQSRQTRLGSGLAWPRLWLLYIIYVIYIYILLVHTMYSTQIKRKKNLRDPRRIRLRPLSYYRRSGY